MATYIRAVAAVVGVGLLAFAGVIGGIALFTHQSPLRVLMTPIAPPPEQVFGKDHLLVLVVGLDYDYDKLDVESSKSSRSDIIKVINLDFNTHRAYVLSVPRDMDAIMPNGQEAKINQAQSDGGITESQAVIAKWLGIPGFDRYVILRIDTMKDLINAIGGVDVTIMNSDALKHQGPNGPVNYDDSWGHLRIHLKPGPQHLNGEEAVGYARFRHDWCSDPCRIMRQDQIIRALVARLQDNKLNTLVHLNGLRAVMHRDVETNFSTREELSIANGFSGMGRGAIETAQVPYVSDKIIPDFGDVIIPDEAARTRLVESMLLNPPRPQAPLDRGALRAIAASNVRVDVENGTSTPGIARRVAALLKAKGFAIGTVGNATSTQIARTELHVHAASTLDGAKVRQALGIPMSAPILEDIPQTRASNASLPASDVVVLIGTDLAASLGTEASAGL